VPGGVGLVASSCSYREINRWTMGWGVGCKSRDNAPCNAVSLSGRVTPGRMTGVVRMKMLPSS